MNVSNMDSAKGPYEKIKKEYSYSVLKPKSDEYGELAERWWKNLLSDNPDKYVQGQPVFLRGEYDYVGKGKERRQQVYPPVNRKRLKIHKETELVFPVEAAEFNIKDENPYKDDAEIKTTKECEECAEMDIEQGGIPSSNQATINDMSIVDDLTNYRLKKPRHFKLAAGKGSLLGNKMEYPMPSGGPYDAVTDGYWLCVKLGASGSPYRLKFACSGPRQYSNTGEYDIEVMK